TGGGNKIRNRSTVVPSKRGCVSIRSGGIELGGYMARAARVPAPIQRASAVHGYSLGQHTSGVASPTGLSSAHLVALAACAYLIRSSFRQIRNCSCKIDVVDQLKTAIAAALTGLGVGSVFRVRDKRLCAHTTLEPGAATVMARCAQFC